MRTEELIQGELFPFGWNPLWAERRTVPDRSALPAPAQETVLEFVTDKTAEPGDVLSAMVDLLVDLGRKG